MTRFARAKGAAASNERVEEEATPWHQMVQQMRSINGEGTHTTNRNQGIRDVEDLSDDMLIAEDDSDEVRKFSEYQGGSKSERELTHNNSESESDDIDDTGNKDNAGIRSMNIG